MEKRNIRRRKFYKKHKSVIKQEKQYKDLGTGYLYSNPEEKEKDEIEAIQREKQRLGLCI